jgi:hypothetical protein
MEVDEEKRRADRRGVDEGKIWRIEGEWMREKGRRIEGDWMREKVGQLEGKGMREKERC